MSNNLGRRWPKGQLYPYERRVDFFRSLGSRALSNHRPASFSAACVGVHHGQRIDARAVAGAKPFLEISTPEAVEPSRRQQRFAVGRSKCVCNTANPECKSGDDSVCSWAIKDIDCPDNGCFAFGITLPRTFGVTRRRLRRCTVSPTRFQVARAVVLGEFLSAEAGCSVVRYSPN